MVLFSSIPNVYSITGAVLIFTSSLGLAVRKYFKNVKTKQKDSNSKIEDLNKDE